MAGEVRGGRRNNVLLFCTESSIKYDLKTAVFEIVKGSGAKNRLARLGGLCLGIGLSREGGRPHVNLIKQMFL